MVNEDAHAVGTECNFTALTERQRECLLLVYTHHTIAEIAGKLGLSIDGVNYHLGGARKAIGASSSAQAARMLYEGRPPTDYITHVAIPNAVAEITGSSTIVSSADDQPTPPLVSEERAVFDATCKTIPAPSAPESHPQLEEQLLGDTVKKVLDWVCRIAGIILMLLFLAYTFSIVARYLEDLHSLRPK